MLFREMSSYFRLAGLVGVLFMAFAVAQGCETKPKAECETNKDCGSGKFCNKATSTCKRLACESNTDCANGEVCENGDCVKGTPTDGGGTDTASGDTKPDTPSTTDAKPGDSTGGDTPPAGPCKGLKECTADGDCTNAKCLGGCCLPACENGTCPAGFKCNATSQQCVLCTEDSDCPVLGQVCDKEKGTCGDQKQCPGGKAPDANGKCPGACEGTTCAAGETPDPDDNCKCIKKIGQCEACTKDAECGIGNKCVEDTQKNKFCATDCTSNSKCDAGYTCLSLGDYSVCMPATGFCPCLGVKCDAGKTCCKSRGACFECCSDADCTKAGDICRADGTCGSSDPCKGVTCGAGQMCNSTTGQCDCASPCPSGTCCGANDNKCTAAACGGGGGGNCNPACTGGQQCCPGLIPGMPPSCQAQCQGGGAGGCKTNADCKSGEECCKTFGFCLPASPLNALICGGGGGGGTQCTSDADCQQGQKCQTLLPGFPGTCQ